MKKPLRRFFAIKETLFDLEFIKVCLCVFYATGVGGALAVMSPTTQEATQELLRTTQETTQEMVCYGDDHW